MRNTDCAPAKETSPPWTTPAEIFANGLISQTILNAGQKAFYKVHWGTASPVIHSVSDLPSLPVVTKEDAGRFFATFEFAEPPAIVSHTSGTSGKITTRCRSAEEINVLLKVREESPPRTADGLIPLVLAVDCANHGQTIVQSCGELGLKAVGFDLEVIDHVIQQLVRTYRFPGYTPRVRAIHASLGFIKMLTVELQRRNIDARSLAVDLLSTFGEYVSPRWSRWLQTSWNATHFDRFATSETVGGASRCPHCGWFTFDPESWPEVVSTNYQHPIDVGVGLLALTELFPFSQLQPMIRFLTGDLVELGTSQCELGHGRTFRFLGRYDRALLDRRTEPRVLLYPTEVADLLDECPQLTRARTFHQISVDEWSQGLAAPLAHLDVDNARERSRIVVAVCPQFSTICFPEAANSLRECLTSGLMAKCTGLADLVHQGMYDLEVRLQQSTSELEPYTAT